MFKSLTKEEKDNAKDMVAEFPDTIKAICRALKENEIKKIGNLDENQLTNMQERINFVSEIERELLKL